MILVPPATSVGSDCPWCKRAVDIVNSMVSGYSSYHGVRHLDREDLTRFAADLNEAVGGVDEELRSRVHEALNQALSTIEFVPEDVETLLMDAGGLDYIPTSVISHSAMP